MPPTINELIPEVTTNTFDKIQNFPLCDCTDIVLDQCHCNNKFIQGSLTTHSIIYGASSTLLLFFFFNLKRHMKVKEKGNG